MHPITVIIYDNPAKPTKGLRGAIQAAAEAHGAVHTVADPNKVHIQCETEGQRRDVLKALDPLAPIQLSY